MGLQPLFTPRGSRLTFLKIFKRSRNKCEQFTLVSSRLKDTQYIRVERAFSALITGLSVWPKIGGGGAPKHQASSSGQSSSLEQLWEHSRCNYSRDKRSFSQSRPNALSTWLKFHGIISSMTKRKRVYGVSFRVIGIRCYRLRLNSSRKQVNINTQYVVSYNENYQCKML